MAESVVLRAQLEKAEATITELRQRKLAIEAEKAEVEQRERRVDEEIRTMENIAQLLRGVLATPEGATLAPRLVHENPAQKGRGVRSTPTKAILHAGSKRDRVFTAFEKMAREYGGPVPRKDFLKRCLDEGIVGHEEAPDVALTNLMSRLKHVGLITNGERGMWTLGDWTQVVRKE